MRPGELCALRPCDLDRSGSVWLYTVADGGKAHHENKPARRWVGPRAQAILAAYLDGKPADARLFPILRAYYSNCVKRACGLAGCEPWTPHALRTTHATAIARETGSAQAAADAIGDSLGVAAKHYIKCDPREESRRKIADQYG
ncbi:MAG: site-specific integrase [Planctomycetia bacterium]|nr:site-specific integrase [Planctomycetia bacterium]